MNFSDKLFQNLKIKASLVAQWWKINLPVQETWAWWLVWEDPTCHEQLSACTTATQPRLHNYSAQAPQLLSPGSRATQPMRHSYSAQAPQLLSPGATTPKAQAPRPRALQPGRPLEWEAQDHESTPCSLQLGKGPHSNKDPAQPKINKNLFKKLKSTHCNHHTNRLNKKNHVAL